jgi:hypothetical protein
MNTLKHWNAKSLGRAIFLGVSASILLYSTNATAAERVVLKYGNFRGPVSVKELNQFVQTGQATPTMAAYLKAAGQDPAVARKALTSGIKADNGFLNNLLSSWAGPIFINQVGEVIHPPSNQADDQSLRSALAQSIKKDGKVTLLNTIQNYPGDSVEIEGERIIPVYKRLSVLSQSL